MSKLHPKSESAQRRKISLGPLFTIVRNDGFRFAHYIYAYEEPDHDEVVSVAERTVSRYKAAYGRGYHWEPPDVDRPLQGYLRGTSALAEAKRIILDDPNTSAGQRFLLERKKLADAMGIPTEKRSKYASRKELDKLEKNDGRHNEGERHERKAIRTDSVVGGVRSLSGHNPVCPG